MKIDLLSMSLAELKEYLSDIGEQGFRASQMFDWMHKGFDIDEMSNLSKKLREKLSEVAFVNLPRIERKLVSALDGTVKYLFELYDGQLIESVVMRYEHGISICISSQAGCRMGCKFCASTIGGLVRNLLPSEMLGQIIAAQWDIGERISNVVMMGTGEPLDNYDNVIKFLTLVGSPEGLNIGYRHISLSTCGVVDKIYKLSQEEFPITLSISLHSPDDVERSALMPINNRWNIDALLTACRDYFDKTGRRISFEYTLISGKNDTREQALRLASTLKKYMGSVPFHVNLIPVNSVTETGFVTSRRDAVSAFQKTLEENRINATVRRTLGGDINASCGQLRRSAMNEKKD